MPKIHRLRDTDRIFFITSNVLQGHQELAGQEFNLIIQVLEQTHRRLGYALCGYVLMPDHWHALIWPRYPLTISEVLKEIKEISARRLNRRRQTNGHFWQHRYWDRFVRNEKEFNKRLEYLHLNPVRKGLVRSPEEWRWSSYNNFSLDRKVVASCLIQIDYIHLSHDYRG
jgi:putative transposase